LITCLIGVATLTPIPGAPSTPGPFCIACGELGTLDFVLNVGMFFPLGFAVSLADSAKRWFWYPIALSLVVELLQLRVVSGRDASLSDLLANSLGGLVGIAAVRWGRSTETHRLWRAGAAAGLAFPLVLSGFFSWALRPAQVSERVWTQIQPRRRGYHFFEGTVAVDMLGRSWRNGVGIDPGDHPSLESGLTAATLTVHRPRGMFPRRKLLFRLTGKERVYFQVAQDFEDATARVAQNATSLGLRGATFRLPQTFAQPDTDLVIRVRVATDRVELESSGTVRGKRAVRLPVTVARGWEVLSPMSFPSPRTDALLRHGWLVVAFAIAGVLAVGGLPTAVGLAGVSAAIVAALFLVPQLAGLARATVPEFLCAAGGAVLGALGAQGLSHLRRRRAPGRGTS
jgi:hypothetical protein